MSLDEGKWRTQCDGFPDARDCRMKSTEILDALPSYEYLFSLKKEMPKELFAYIYRELLKWNTANVSVDLRLKMFEGIDPSDIMFQNELDTIEGFGDSITVYRGALKDEDPPGLSWSLRKDVAENSDYYQGKLFIAEIPKSAILLYIHDENEEEIIAHVTSGY